MGIFLYSDRIVNQLQELYNNFKSDFLLEDEFEIISTESYIEMRKKSEISDGYVLEDVPFFVLKHHSLFDIMKSSYYFFLNSHKYQSIIFREADIVFYFRYENKKMFFKEKDTDKRVKSEISIKDLRECLLYYHNGSVMNEKNGSTAIANKENFLIQGHAFDTNVAASKHRAMLEYLERIAASITLPSTLKRTFNEISAPKITPKLFGAYKKEAMTKYELVPYHDDLEMNWVKGKSVYSNEECYVPEQMVQYLITDMDNKCIIDSSNGCAVGNSLEEATLYALLEVIERDVFMNYWFGDLTLEKIVHEDKRILSKEMYYNELGYNLSFYSISNPTDIPVVWGLLTSQNERNPIYSITGLGCHLNIEEAIYSSFGEVNNSFVTLTNNQKENLLEEIERIGNSGKITALIEHLYYFASYKAKDIITNKIQDSKPIHVSILKKKMPTTNIDIRDDLHYVIEQIKPVYKDAIIVDQTNNFLESISLKCVKAILLGAIPLDFTSELIRVMDDEVSKMKIKQKNFHPLA
ncbi:YcaO-like family protein [Priestia taiwanensis]|uniref:YcaO domain-containing protein n=1 Tax=Priestia taiwanensis TaxID=1347902 RepID=A0A917AL88_9BACI|nr:YcaO-like family protein [Priestia taiwanensis]MBM7362042.1 thiazole/oxazole-forming peptide maturase SagD family component [Priestia taiwanensis]GGE59000.1 hypothetical protein GCM10007140_06670 [Priestia taiwanensis]